MLPSQRQAYILQRARSEGGFRVQQLVTELGVSDMTVRRDLDVLARRGQVIKVHGGAVLVPDGAAHEPGFQAKSLLRRSEKTAIAAQAAQLMQPGAAVAVSAGTTTYHFARHLASIPRITVVTNSIHVADVLHATGEEDQTVILTGGVRTPSDALVGPYASQTLRSFSGDYTFLGGHGMDPYAGFTTPNVLEAETDIALIAAGHRLVVLADNSKWETVGICSIARLDQADILITDNSLSDSAAASLRSRVGEIVLAPVDRATTATA